MGSCVSLHKSSESTMKLNLSIESKDENFLIPSPVKDKPDTVNVGYRTISKIGLKSHRSPPRFRDAGSKDEAFFDSQPWLESDCEDDYFSVNGDFTPSRGNTPVHHNLSLANLRANKAPVAEETPSSSSEASPQEKKKRLSELFKESLHSDSDVVDDLRTKTKAEATGPSLEMKSRNGSLYSEKASNGLSKSEEKSGKSVQCCIPMLRSSRSFGEREMNPSHSVG